MLDIDNSLVKTKQTVANRTILKLNSKQKSKILIHIDLMVIDSCVKRLLDSFFPQKSLKLFGALKSSWRYLNYYHRYLT